MMKKLSFIILFLLFLISCGKKDAHSYLKIFKYNEAAGILTLDPIYAKDQPHIWACNQLYNSLVAFDNEMNVVPAVAKSWDISEDGKTYTFMLRDDVFFHNDSCFGGQSRRVVAQDFEYSFNRLIDRKLSSPGTWIFAQVKQLSAWKNTSSRSKKVYVLPSSEMSQLFDTAGTTFISLSKATRLLYNWLQGCYTIGYKPRYAADLLHKSGPK